MNSNDIDLSISLLLNESIKIPNVGEISQLTINEIRKITFKKFYMFLHWICMNSDDIGDLLNTFEKIDPFDLIYAECYHNEEFRILIFEGLSKLFHSNISLGDNCFYVGDEGVIYKDNFDVITNIIKLQNCIEQKKRRILSDEQKNFYKQLQEKREKYRECFKDKESDISDIISSTCSKHPSINLYNVGNLTVYQLTNQFKRLNMIENYSISIDSLLAGADKNDVTLKHWSSKII